VLFVSTARAEDPDVRSAPGIDWENLVVRATGAGPPDVNALGREQARAGAEKAAKSDAFRNLLEQVKGVPLNAATTVGQAMAAEEIRGKVETVVRNYKVTSKRYYSDLGLEMDVAIALPALAEIFAQPASSSAGSPPDAGQRAGRTKVTSSKDNTGLVVDARGLKPVPALAPRLVAPSGNELYGLASLSADARKSSGAASYVHSLDQAKKNLRVGGRPLVLKAVKAEGSDLVLAAEANAKLEHSGGYLAEGRVIVVMD
jgi:hypothetical protein